jgi:1-acyl-sn-glycerol-3-phosphate acyltransferase
VRVSAPGDADPVTARLYQVVLYLLAPLTVAAALLHVVLGLVYAALTFSWIGRRGRDAAVMAWSRLLLLIVGVRLQVVGGQRVPDTSAALGSLLLINHTSWLDVFSIAAVTPARFVAKSEIGRWPVFGWLATVVGTLFVERGRRHAVMRTNHAVAARLRAGQLIGIFPEGTTTDGSRLLPFHANLVQPAIDLGAPLQPVGVRFTQGGTLSRAAMFIGDMNLMQSLWRVATAPHLAVEVHWLPPLQPPPVNRHAAGRAARAAIASALHIPLEDAAAVRELSLGVDGEDTEPGTRSAPAS